jgi:hypothetical protein
MRTLRPWIAAAALLCAIDARATPNLPDQLDTDNGFYTLFYDDNIYSTHYMPPSLIQSNADALDRVGSESIGNPKGYRDGYLDLGLMAPYFNSDPGPIRFWRCGSPVDDDDPDCDNGMSNPSQITMPSEKYGVRSASCNRAVLGHELFHNVEYAYINAGAGSVSGCSGTFGKTVCEGMARAMQDKIYFDLDLNPAASCMAPFLGEVDNYLDNPDRALWSASYGAALFWTYLMEQYGSFNEEPYRGADFITAWWEIAQDHTDDPNPADITRQAIQLFEPNHSFTNAYHDFTIANLVKDLSVLAIPAQQRARYTYIDEQPVLGQNNQMSFGPVDIDFNAEVLADGSTAQIVLNARQLGGDYSAFDLSACPAGREVSFSVQPNILFPLNNGAQTPTPDALISLILTTGADGKSPRKLYKWRAQSVNTSFVQPGFQPYTRGFVIVSGWHGTYPGVLRMRCLPAPLAPIVHLASNDAEPGPGPQPVGSVKVRQPNPATGTSRSGLGIFKINVGGQDAPIESIVPDGDGHRVRFRHPSLSGPGPFALAVESGGQTTTIANAVGGTQTRQVTVVLDLSDDMDPPSLLPAVQKVREAAARMPANTMFSLIAHFGNGNEPDLDASVLLPLAPLTAAHRGNLESVLSTLTATASPQGAPADGVRLALNQFNSVGVNGPREILLITNGGGGEGEPIGLLLPAVQKVRIQVMAFGDKADQPLWDGFARAAGGNYHFIPVGATGVNQEALDLAAEAVHAAQTREHVLLARQAQVPAATPLTTTLLLDNSLLHDSGALHFSVQRSATSAMPSSIRLFRPDGSEVLAGAGVAIVDTPRERVFQLSGGPNGLWRIDFLGASAGGASDLQLRVIVDEHRAPSQVLRFARGEHDASPLDSFELGEPVEAHAASGGGGGAGKVSFQDLHFLLRIERPDGVVVETPMSPRSNGDAFNPDAFATAFARLDLTRWGSPTNLPDDPLQPGVRGSYRVVLETRYGPAAGGVVQRTTASFAVADTSVDTDLDQLPDRYEAAHACLDSNTSAAGATVDADGDGLSTASERLHGTDPCAVDTDDGGETDGSEVAAGGNPLDPRDDALPRISHAEVVTSLSQHEDYEPLPPLAHVLQFASDSRYHQVIVKSGPGTLVLNNTAAVIDADAAHGRYVLPDRNAGETYCYQLIPQTAAGRVGAASDVFCAVGKQDMTAPGGSIVLEDGAPRTSKTLLSAQIEFDNESKVGAEMRLRLPDGSDTGWIPYAPTHAIDVSMLPRPSQITVQAQVRDAADNESEPYVDDIALVEAATVGRIVGRVLGNGQPLDLVDIHDPNNAAMPHVKVFSGSGGVFQFPDLEPGTYTLEFAHPHYDPQFRGGITVAAGDVNNVGDIELSLTPAAVPLFKDGFE